jgi:hypothetical protein
MVRKIGLSDIPLLFPASWSVTLSIYLFVFGIFNPRVNSLPF